MQRLFLTWAHFFGKKLFITCVHAVHRIQDRLGCKHSLMELPAPSFLHWEARALLAVLQGIAGKHWRCDITCLVPTCAVAAAVGGEEGALRYIVILALAAHLPFHPCPTHAQSHCSGFLAAPASSVPCSHTVNTLGPAPFWEVLFWNADVSLA